MEKEPESLSNRTVALLIVTVMAVVFIMVAFVLSKAKQKPQSPQAMVAAALNGTFGIQEWKPGMGPQPFMYHPAAQNQLSWRPLPGAAATQPSPGAGAAGSQSPQGQPGAPGWSPLPAATSSPGIGGAAQPGIRAYRGPAQ